MILGEPAGVQQELRSLPLRKGFAGGVLEHLVAQAAAGVGDDVGHFLMLERNTQSKKIMEA